MVTITRVLEGIAVGGIVLGATAALAFNASSVGVLIAGVPAALSLGALVIQNGVNKEEILDAIADVTTIVNAWAATSPQAVSSNPVATSSVGSMLNPFPVGSAFTVYGWYQSANKAYGVVLVQTQAVYNVMVSEGILTSS
jgi:hypothetical protein